MPSEVEAASFESGAERGSGGPVSLEECHGAGGIPEAPGGCGKMLGVGLIFRLLCGFEAEFVEQSPVGHGERSTARLCRKCRCARGK